jgi:hypothetical protein
MFPSVGVLIMTINVDVIMALPTQETFRQFRGRWPFYGKAATHRASDVNIAVPI